TVLSFTPVVGTGTSMS
nr:immunoglobulin heavy chain junction region [Mus musculus]